MSDIEKCFELIRKELNNINNKNYNNIDITLTFYSHDEDSDSDNIKSINYELAKDTSDSYTLQEIIKRNHNDNL